MQVLANDLAKHMIRVNTIHPTGVATGMTMNEAMMRMVSQGDPALAGSRARLPEPPAMPTVRTLQILRGVSDSLALRRACHDSSLHERLAPARLGWAVGKDPNNVFCRQWLMKPGTAATNPFGGTTNDQVQMNPGNKNPVFIM